MRTTTLVAALMLAGCGGEPQTTTEGTEEVSQAKVIPVTTKSPEALAAFERGRTLQENFRMTDAIVAFDEALALDPDFAMAHAYRSDGREGNDGLEELRSAAKLAATHPEAERVSIEAMLAWREGDITKSKELWAKAVELAPDDWRGHHMLGVYAFQEQDWKGALEPLKRATELNPDAGPSWNLLGYTHAELGDWDSSIAALEKYATLVPGEANPHDSLGEVMLRAGRFEDAEKAFAKAVEIDPKFTLGYAGLAQTKFLRGDWTGGRTAIGSGLAVAPRAEERVGMKIHLAWSWYAAGDKAQAEALLAEAEAEAEEAKLTVTYADIAEGRAVMALLSKDWAGATASGKEALRRVEAAKVEGGALISVRLFASALATVGLGIGGKTADAEAALPGIEADVAKFPEADWITHFAKGAIALGKKDNAGAIAEFGQCDPTEALCLWALGEAHEKAGDTAAAEATRAKVIALNYRYGQYLGVWSAVGGNSALTAVSGP